MAGKRIPKRATINIDEDTLEALKSAKGRLSNNEYLKLLLPLTTTRVLKICKSRFDDAHSVVRGSNKHEGDPHQVDKYFDAIFQGLVLLLNRGNFDDVLDFINDALEDA